jgi:hypothetical protein
LATKIRAIVLHKRPHGDEILAVWILMNAFADRAEVIFPGITTARILFVDAGTVFSNPSADVMEQQGILCIGVGGGRFDEHPHNGQARKKNECSATLIATVLGVNNDQLVKPLVDYARRVDLEGKDDPFDLFSLIKTLQLQTNTDKEMMDVILWSVAALNAWWAWRQNPRGFYNDNMLQLFGLIMTEEHQKSAQIAKHFTQCLSGGFHPFSLGRLAYLVSLHPSLGPNSIFMPDLGVLDRGIEYARMWANRVLDAKVKEQRDFDRAVSELHSAMSWRIEKHNDANVGCLAVVAKSDNYQISRAARYIIEDLGVLIQVRSTGHIQIFTNKNHPLFKTKVGGARLTTLCNNIAYNIREAELKIRGLGYTALTNPEKLMVEGQFAGAHMWHYFAQGHMMLNGTPTAPNQTPTSLTLDYVVLIVKTNIEIILDFNHPAQPSRVHLFI